MTAIVAKVSNVILNRHRRAAVQRLLKLLPDDEKPVAARVGDEASPDALVAACEGPLYHTPYGFLLARSEFPSFNSLLRPKANNGRRLNLIEEEFQEVVEAYGAAPGKWFLGLIFEAGAHYYLYTDQPLAEVDGLDFIRFSDQGRDRCVASLEAFVESHKLQKHRPNHK
jgi:hypothetical protein